MGAEIEGRNPNPEPRLDQGGRGVREAKATAWQWSPAKAPEGASRNEIRSNTLDCIPIALDSIRAKREALA